MTNEVSIARVYLACGSTGICNSFDGLAVIVKECFELDPSLPVFCILQ